MLPSFATDTLTVLEPVLVDDRGTLTPDWTQPPTETTITGCSVQPAGSDETDSRQNVAVRLTVYMPPGSPVTAWSRIRYQGGDYHVDGHPDVWKSPTGSVSHMVARLTQWKG